MARSRRASQAVRQVKNTTPQKLSTHWNWSLCQKIPTSDAMTTPNRPMTANWPNPVRSRRVTLPNSASPPNIAAVITKVVATDSFVKSSRTKERNKPVSAEYARNSSDAVAGASFWTRALRKITMPNWAMISTQNDTRLPAMLWTSAGEDATSQAVRAVTASPANIQAYTARRNPAARARSVAEYTGTAGVPGTVGEFESIETEIGRASCRE